jgi:hypothetical protein
MLRNTMRSLLGVALAALLAGCGYSRPPLTEVEGTVLLNNEPLPNAQVQFVPDLKHFGAEMNSTGVTDAQGHFKLTCLWESRPGAAVGKHHVLVTEAPTPAEARGQNEEAQARFTQYMKGLKNRPIPDQYGALNKTPLEVEVKADQKTYDLKLTR